jgi:hypothetical protein
MLWQDTQDMFGKLQVFMGRIEARLGTLEAYVEEIHAVQKSWDWRGDRGAESPKSKGRGEGAEQ